MAASAASAKYVSAAAGGNISENKAKSGQRSSGVCEKYGINGSSSSKKMTKAYGGNGEKYQLKKAAAKMAQSVWRGGVMKMTAYLAPSACGWRRRRVVGDSAKA